MEKTLYSAENALRLLKAGLRLRSVIDKREIFFEYKDGLVFVYGENEGLSINEYRFLELYQGARFEKSEENEEEAVDPKKDEEYYSWRQ